MPEGHTGSGKPATAQEIALDRKERLRRLALETVDLSKDPYMQKNHVGKIECRLCLTLHLNTSSYLTHTQGRKHQTNLARRAFRERGQSQEDAREGETEAETLVRILSTVTGEPPPPGRSKAQQLQERRGGAEKSASGLEQGKVTAASPSAPSKHAGRPAYRVCKFKEPESSELALSFEVAYPLIEEGTEPRHRFMSTFEQTLEPIDTAWQYLAFAAEPYETIAFKIPTRPVDIKAPFPRFIRHWDDEAKVYFLQFYFVDRL